MAYNFYAYTDKALKYLRRYFVREFNRAEIMIRADSLNVVGRTQDLYRKLEKETLRVFLKIARNKYKEFDGTDTLEMAWLLGFLSESNPITGYIFMSDTDRKRQYYAESLMSGGDVSKETKKALRYYYGSVKQYADLVTDEAAMQAYVSAGMQFVEWIAQQDGKVCYVCRSRDKVIYPIKNVPKKPHYGCRCYLRKVSK